MWKHYQILLVFTTSWVCVYSGFNFGNMFNDAFGGGTFQFNMGGGMQMPKAVAFPPSVKNVISPEFEFLKGTEWMWNKKDSCKFGLDGVFVSTASECVAQKRCLWAAYAGVVYVMMSQSGLYRINCEKTFGPAEANISEFEKLVLTGSPDNNKSKSSAVKLTFSRIYDFTSRENLMNLYAILDVPVTASMSEIKKAYRRLSIEHHPDKNAGDPNAQARFSEISRANEILSDPVKRVLYGTGGMEAIRALDKGEIQKGQDTLVEVHVPLEDIYVGKSFVEKKFSRRVVCVMCATVGGGKSTSELCSGCSKCPSEMRMVNQQVGPGFFVQQQVQVDSKEFCKNESIVLEVPLARGVSEGTEVVMDHLAEQRPGILPGNVIVRIHEKGHPKFKRAGNNLTTQVSVELKEALLGFSQKLTKLDGTPLYVEKGKGIVTQPNDVIVMDGEGLPLKEGTVTGENNTSDRGDLLVTVNVKFPKKLTEAQKSAIRDTFLD